MGILQHGIGPRMVLEKGPFRIPLYHHSTDPYSEHAQNGHIPRMDQTVHFCPLGNHPIQDPWSTHKERNGFHITNIVSQDVYITHPFIACNTMHNKEEGYIQTYIGTLCYYITYTFLHYVYNACGVTRGTHNTIPIIGSITLNMGCIWGTPNGHILGWSKCGGRDSPFSRRPKSQGRPKTASQSFRESWEWGDPPPHIT